LPRLQEKYRAQIAEQLKKELGLDSIMAVPRLSKITLNMGVGEAAADKKQLQNAVEDMIKITGRQPLITKTKKSIAAFKIREDWPIGCKVTLRRKEMYEFLDRLITIYLPRVRDFRGLSKKAFDGRGNYSLGIKEQIVCPEIEYDKIDKIRGFNITITTTSKSDEHCRALLKAFNFPIRD
jgi:large subunit ribosomal protein L5